MADEWAMQALALGVIKMKLFEGLAYTSRHI